jgi:hypothetical protein
MDCECAGGIKAFLMIHTFVSLELRKSHDDDWSHPEGNSNELSNNALGISELIYQSAADEFRIACASNIVSMFHSNEP